MDHQNGIQIPDILIESIIVDGLVDSGAGFFAMPEDYAEKLDKLGLEPLVSNLIGKMPMEKHANQAEDTMLDYFTMFLVKILLMTQIRFVYILNRMAETHSSSFP